MGPRRPALFERARCARRLPRRRRVGARAAAPRHAFRRARAFSVRVAGAYRRRRRRAGTCVARRTPAVRSRCGTRHSPRGACGMRRAGDAVIAEARTYAARCRAHNLPAAMPTGTLRLVCVEVVNDGNGTCRRHAPPGPSVDLAVHVDGELVTTIPLVDDVLEPGGTTSFAFKWRAPQRSGSCRVELDMVEQNVTFFAAHQSPLLQVEIGLEAREPSLSERWLDVSWQRNYWFYLPTEGVAWSAHGP